MLASALAQWLPDDESDPEYKSRCEGAKKYQQDMENIYPQICIDCVPAVEKRMKEAKYQANADNLRRLMNKTRNRQNTITFRSLSWLRFFSVVGRYFTIIGILGQLTWNGLGVFGTVGSQAFMSIQTMPQFPKGSPVHNLFLVFLHILPLPGGPGGVPRSAGFCLLLSILSFWWNPKFRDTIRCFDSHMSGRKEYYATQAILIATRGLFWLMMGKGPLGQPDSSASRAAHLFMFVFTAAVCIEFTSFWSLLIVG
jgi:hypothetical protein